MKTFYAALLVFISLFSLTLSAPPSVERRQVADATAIFTDLFSSVQKQTAIINSTTSGISSSSTAADNNTSVDTIGTALTAITSAVNSATTQLSALGTSKRALLQARQADNTALATLVFNLLLEISGTLNNVIATLGLEPLLGFLTPLVSSLSGLLLSLKHVLDQVLALVKQLVDGLLTGLSIGLAGLIL